MGGLNVNVAVRRRAPSVRRVNSIEGPSWNWPTRLPDTIAGPVVLVTAGTGPAQP